MALDSHSFPAQSEGVNKYNNEPFTPVTPCADNDDLAAQGKRVILTYQRFGAGLQTAQLSITPDKELCSGWVIGFIRD